MSHDIRRRAFFLEPLWSEGRGGFVEDGRDIRFSITSHACAMSKSKRLEKFF